jgi:hypothetical protein
MPFHWNVRAQNFNNPFNSGGMRFILRVIKSAIGYRLFGEGAGCGQTMIP